MGGGRGGLGCPPATSCLAACPGADLTPTWPSGHLDRVLLSRWPRCGRRLTPRHISATVRVRFRVRVRFMVAPDPSQPQTPPPRQLPPQPHQGDMPRAAPAPAGGGLRASRSPRRRRRSRGSCCQGCMRRSSARRTWSMVLLPVTHLLQPPLPPALPPALALARVPLHLGLLLLLPRGRQGTSHLVRWAPSARTQVGWGGGRLCKDTGGCGGGASARTQQGYRGGGFAAWLPDLADLACDAVCFVYVLSRHATLHCDMRPITPQHSPPCGTVLLCAVPSHAICRPVWNCAVMLNRATPRAAVPCCTSPQAYPVTPHQETAAEAGPGCAMAGAPAGRTTSAARR